jgi:hypothetical protein
MHCTGRDTQILQTSGWSVSEADCIPGFTERHQPAGDLRGLEGSRGMRLHRPLLSMQVHGCGLRLSELLHLQVRDIDSSGMVIHVRQGKGAKDRLVARKRSKISHRLFRLTECAEFGSGSRFPLDFA